MRSGIRRTLSILWLLLRGVIIGVPLLVLLWKCNYWLFNEWPKQLVIVRRDHSVWLVQTCWTAGSVSYLACIAKESDLRDWEGQLPEFEHLENETVDQSLPSLEKDHTLIALDYGRLVPYASGYVILDDNRYLTIHNMWSFRYQGQPTWLPTGLRWPGVLFWLLLLSLIGNTIWVAVRSPCRWLVRRRRIRSGCCEDCGYNLKGLALGVPCPECGKSSQPPPLTPT